MVIATTPPGSPVVAVIKVGESLSRGSAPDGDTSVYSKAPSP